MDQTATMEVDEELGGVTLFSYEPPSAEDATPYESCARASPEERPDAFGEFNCDVRTVKNKDRILRFLGTTAVRDRMGDEIPLKGWDFASFRKNPVFLWGHEYWQPAIGKVVKISRETVGNADGWAFDVEFAPPEVSERAEQFFKLVKWLGFAAVSVGFRSLKSERIDEGEEERAARSKDEPDNAPGYRFEKKELLELSLVTVPANPEALLVARRKGLAMPQELGLALDQFAEREEARQKSKAAIAKTRALLGMKKPEAAAEPPAEEEKATGGIVCEDPTAASYMTNNAILDPAWVPSNWATSSDANAASVVVSFPTLDPAAFAKFLAENRDTILEMLKASSTPTEVKHEEEPHASTEAKAQPQPAAEAPEQFSHSDSLEVVDDSDEFILTIYED